MKPICIYHGGCDDGFGAAWAVYQAVGKDFEYYPGVYGEAPPDVTGRDVLLVDFSYKKDILKEMSKTARSITILDHHRTAMEDLAEFPALKHNRMPWLENSDYFELGMINVLFDMTRSGAGIAWDFFHPYKPRHWFINYLEDRDLWKKQLPGCDEFTIALRSFPQTFAEWDILARKGPSYLIGEGVAILRYYRQIIELMKKTAYEANLGGHSCMAANVPYFAASEVANEIGPEDTFGLTYFEDSPGCWKYSLRSRGNFDVSALAKLYGGGGHAKAAGFSSDKPVHTGMVK